MTAFETRRPVASAAAPRGPWTDLPAAPRGYIHAAVARRIFAKAAADVGIVIELPDGPLMGKRRGSSVAASGAPVMRLHRPGEFFRRLGRHGLIGFGESYMAGDWDADDVAAVLTPLARRISVLVPNLLQRARRWYGARQPASEMNDLRGAKSNISRHYDLSNDLFALFLDETMTYSSAIWPNRGAPLAAAQEHKIDRLLDLAGVRGGTRLLEIGTGWGELAVRAASRGAHVTTLTLSSEQQAWAIRRATQSGVGDLVDVQLRDYRQVTGTYDAVISVEMIEAVGVDFWPTYFATIDRVLNPGGRAALQSITIDHQRLIATKDCTHGFTSMSFPAASSRRCTRSAMS